MNCRHCDKPIRQGEGGRWVHLHHLRRCHQPEDVPVYGYEAEPDDGKACECWACVKFGPIGADLMRRQS